ncbi:C-type lectin domain family 10 member A-like [Sander lucioperca]|uniref:C-type lectin domain family 10 member A-like n=1 Tax=Sander lucioperca TaxID=283035 RepID=UPI00125E046F|nr:C-type lectin domain family 10 member A-like [Sander lucioperca]
MEMVCHKEDHLYGNVPDPSAKRVESKICSDEDRNVAAAEPGIKRYRLAAVILGLLCVLQAALIIFLLLSLFSERDEFKRTNLDVEAGFKNLTEERDDLKRKLNNSVSERDALKRTNLGKYDDETTFTIYSLTTDKQLKNKSELATDRQRSINFTCFTQHCLEGPCPPGWTQFGSRCFSFNIQGKSWTDAENFCNYDGGNLASVHSEEEHVFLRTFINQVTGANQTSWMGGSDSVKEGVWMWSDGSTFDYKSWAWGQPDNKGGDENCLQINYKGMNWNDGRCDKMSPFLCSKKL